MKKFLKNFSFMGMFMLVLSVILGVGGFTGVAFANGVATGIETGGKDDAPQVGRTCLGGQWWQRCRLFRRLYSEMPLLPECRHQLRLRRYPYGFRSTSADF